MTQITMCRGTGCKLKEKCKRFTAKPSIYSQSWFFKIPVKANGSCNKFYSRYK